MAYMEPSVKWRKKKERKIKKIKKFYGDDKWLRRKVGGSFPHFLIHLGRRVKTRKEKMKKEKKKRKMKKRNEKKSKQKGIRWIRMKGGEKENE